MDEDLPDWLSMFALARGLCYPSDKLLLKYNIGSITKLVNPGVPEFLGPGTMFQLVTLNAGNIVARISLLDDSWKYGGGPCVLEQVLSKVCSAAQIVDAKSSVSFLEQPAVKDWIDYVGLLEYTDEIMTFMRSFQPRPLTKMLLDVLRPIGAINESLPLPLLAPSHMLMQRLRAMRALHSIKDYLNPLQRFFRNHAADETSFVHLPSRVAVQTAYDVSHLEERVPFKTVYSCCVFVCVKDLLDSWSIKKHEKEVKRLEEELDDKEKTEQAKRDASALAHSSS